MGFWSNDLSSDSITTEKGMKEEVILWIWTFIRVLKLIYATSACGTPADLFVFKRSLILVHATCMNQSNVRYLLFKETVEE